MQLDLKGGLGTGLDCYMCKSSIYSVCNCHPAHPCQATSLVLKKVSYDGSICMARDDSLTRGTVRNKEM